MRSELYRTITIRSAWVSIAASIFLGLVSGNFETSFWSLFAGVGSYGLAVVVTAQHYQHRTSLLLFLGRPRRLQVLAAQCLCAALIAVVITALGGLLVFQHSDNDKFWATMTAVPMVAVLGVAGATVVRRPMWLLGGVAGWILFVEGIFGRLEQPLPFSAFMETASGNDQSLPILAAWTAAALVAAVVAIRRDLTGD